MRFVSVVSLNERGYAKSRCLGGGVSYPISVKLRTAWLKEGMVSTGGADLAPAPGERLSGSGSL